MVAIEGTGTLMPTEYILFFLIWKLPLDKEHLQKKPITDIILYGDSLKAFSLRSGTRQRCLLSPLSFRIRLEVRSNAVRQEGKKKVYRLGKKK